MVGLLGKRWPRRLGQRQGWRKPARRLALRGGGSRRRAGLTEDTGDIQEKLRSRTRVANAQPAQEGFVDHERVQLGGSHHAPATRRVAQQGHLAHRAVAGY